MNAIENCIYFKVKHSSTPLTVAVTLSVVEGC